MSTKSGIFHDEPTTLKNAATQTHLYEEALVPPGKKESPAYIQVEKGLFRISHDFSDQNPQVAVEIDAEVIDRLAIAWCKHRNLGKEQWARSAVQQVAITVKKLKPEPSQ